MFCFLRVQSGKISLNELLTVEKRFFPLIFEVHVLRALVISAVRTKRRFQVLYNVPKFSE
jgi:hypothetical protein